MILNFGKHRGRDVAEVPDTYLDWLMGEKWFVKRPDAEDVARELMARKRSHYHVEDEYGKTLEEL